MQSKSGRGLAFVALLLGAAGIGCAPIFVRLSEVGPSATAFYRLAFALPVLWLASALEKNGSSSAMTGAAWSPTAGRGLAYKANGRGPGLRKTLWLCALTGTFFAADLAFWHWSIRLTSVANSTLLTNCAPVFVVLGARVLFRERITPLLITGMLVALVGATMLVGHSVRLSPGHLLGDLLALITALFYGSYLLSVKYLRLSLSTAKILAWSGVVSCALLFIIAVLSQESIRVHSWHGLVLLISLAFVSHLSGQGLITYALAHLSAGFSAVGLLLQPVIAALLASLILGEHLGRLQAVGGAVILFGIAIASRGRR